MPTVPLPQVEAALMIRVLWIVAWLSQTDE